MRSGKRAAALALKGVTRCRSSICFKSLEIATAILIFAAENG